MTNVYVVEGSTGEYSDHREWPVAAYIDEDLAREHADKAKKWYLKNWRQGMGWEDEDKLNNPYDPDMSLDYTGTDWTVYKIELRESVRLPSCVSGMGTINE